MSEDEALVFEIVDDEESDESYIEIVNDEKIINKVFDVYYKLVEESAN